MIPEGCAGRAGRIPYDCPVRGAQANAGPLARHGVAARVVRAWRELTGCTGRGRAGPAYATLIGCSGGADSSALVLALARLGPDVAVVGHIVHDLRPREEALADRDAAAALAARCGLRFVEAAVRVRGRGGNAEATARRLRYAALARLAKREGCPFIATAHHADDQLETVLMRLLRGAGPSGLAGVAARRKLTAGVEVIRPMLGVLREEAESLCRASGWTWREDATNADESRVRARLRRRVLPELRGIRRDAAVRAARSVELVRAAAELVEARAARLVQGAEANAGRVSWPRGAMGGEPVVVIGAALRSAVRRVAGGRGMDRAGRSAAERAARAVLDGVGGRREFRVGAGRVWVKSDVVVVERAQDAEGV